MKLAISCQGTKLTDAVDTRFGRAANFLLYDTETKEVSVIPNTQNLQAAQGAGIQSGMTVAKSGAEAIITGHCGPKAFRVLQEGNVKIYLTDNTGSVADAIQLWEDGKLQSITSADVDGHWL
ncbi:MAG: NifB/NifX family molybdenum-iron cluster-binding protein [Lentisphaeria bacterium]